MVSMRIVTTMMANLFKEFLDMAEARPDSLNSSHSVLKFKSDYIKTQNLNGDRFVKQQLSKKTLCGAFRGRTIGQELDPRRRLDSPEKLLFVQKICNCDENNDVLKCGCTPTHDIYWSKMLRLFVA